MSKNKIRIDKTCLNCNYVVSNRFCPNCGQENIDSRKSFHHLFIHFFEDLTHYENAFWKTIKSLLLKPAALTKEYLSGKRMSYLAPVRLYIFISFITFFIFSIIPDTKDDIKETKIDKNGIETANDGVVKISFSEKKGLNINEAKSKKDTSKVEKVKDNEDDFIVMDERFRTVKQLDSVQKFGKAKDKMGTFEFWMTRKIQQVKDKYEGRDLKEKLIENFAHNIPKAFFLYMPIFAFLLWLFHNKQKWYYFDHGIFTLHYFSFLLLIALLMKLTTFGLNLFGDGSIVKFAKGAVVVGALGYMFYYFFPAHHRFYGSRRVKTLVLGSFLFFLNFIFLSFFLTIFIIYSLITIH